MSGLTDPWDAMVQHNDSDEDYIPDGADGIDHDLEEQEDEYRDIDEDDDTSDGDELDVLSPSILSLIVWPQLNSGLVVCADVEYGDDEESNPATISAALQGIIVPRVDARMVRLLQQQADVEEDDDEDVFYTSFWGSMRGLERAGDNWYPKVTEPQRAGVKLLRSGDFGKARNRLGTPRNSNIYSRLKRMGLQQRPLNSTEDLKHNLIPNTHGTTVAAYHSNIYVAQFSPGASRGILFPPQLLYLLRFP